jgi:hypothetical protein
MENTKSFSHLDAYLQEIIRKDYFISRVRKIRKKYKIPRNGYSFKLWGALFCLPLEWPYLYNKKVSAEFDKEVYDICKKYNLLTSSWEGVITEYIFWNKIVSFYVASCDFDLCEIFDSKTPRDNLWQERRKQINKLFPVELRISPYASIKEIIDFIRKNSKIIKLTQTPYIRNKDIDLRKIRTKNQEIQRRNDYAFKLYKKRYSNAEISRIVDDKFGSSTDEGSIGKIISWEKKKRK